MTAISPKSVIKLALTCWALEAPALGALWENQGSLRSLFEHVFPMDIQRYVIPDEDSDLHLSVSLFFLPGVIALNFTLTFCCFFSFLWTIFID